jgi:hypothetical protein
MADFPGCDIKLCDFEISRVILEKTDIKALLFLQPQNLVMMADFPDCDVKLCDFEISRVILEGTEIREILGTPDYVGE